MNTKKMLSLLLCTALLSLSAVSCGKPDEEPSAGVSSAQPETSESSPTDTAEAETSENKKTDSKDSEDDISQTGTETASHSLSAESSTPDVTEASSTEAGEPDSGSSDNSEIKTVAPPENGWTAEELLNVTYFCGKELSCPLTLSSLGEDFSFDTDTVYQRDGNVSLFIDYKGQHLTNAVYISVGSADNVNEDTVIDSFDLNIHGIEELDNPITVNGITFSASSDEAVAALGEPDITDGIGNFTVLKYQFSESEKSKLELAFENDALVDIYFYYINGIPQ